MNIPDTMPEILTFGRFSISVAGKLVAMKWPDEEIKVLFCSLLSPLDLFFTWDRISRSMFGEPVTRINRRRLEEIYIRPLKTFLTRELGFNPLIADLEGIRINQRIIHVDALEFYSEFLDGLRLLSSENDDAARDKFSRADTIYNGRYLPGIEGKIIEHTRNDLESLYRSAVMADVRHARTA
jgi:hypothetical protein